MAGELREKRQINNQQHVSHHEAKFLVLSGKGAQLTALIITILLLSSSLVSIKCASYSQHSFVDAQQQQAGRDRWPHHDDRQRHLFSLFRAGEKPRGSDETASLNDLLGLLASNRDHQSSSASPTTYYRTPPKSLSSFSFGRAAPQLVLDSDSAHYGNIINDNNANELLLNEANFSPLNSRQLVADDTYSNSDNTNFYSSLDDHDDEHPFLSMPATRLAELLSSPKLPASYEQKQNKLTDFLYLPADELASESEQENAIKSQNQKDFYGLIDKEGNSLTASKSIDIDQADNEETTAGPAPPVLKLTTLLENEVKSTGNSSTSSPLEDLKTSTSNIIANVGKINEDADTGKESGKNTSQSDTSSPIDTNNVTDARDGSVSNKTDSSDAIASLWSVSAMFNGLYHKLLGILPTFHKSEPENASTANTLTMSKKNLSPQKISRSQVTPTMDTKHSVSAGLSVEPLNEKGGNSITVTTDALDDKTSLVSINDEQEKDKLESTSDSDVQSQKKQTTQDGSYLNSQLDHTNVVPVKQGGGFSSTFFTDDKRFISTSDANLITPAYPSGHHLNHRVSLMRQSDFSLPYGAPEDQLLVAEGSGLTPVKHTISYGDYVLANHPSTTTHHYSPLKVVRHQPVAAVDTDQVYGQLSSHPYLRHLHPGESVYSSYSRPLYQASSDENGNLNSVANKTNDIYFLVMVVAFCAMAVAVVLSAGLFAYRVQQSRKLTSEQDYPTYGVVGPNNINGKCAASFVGGYFGSNTSMSNPGATGLAGSSINKAASAKYQSDYVDSGIAGSASKSSSVKSKIFGEQAQTSTGSAAALSQQATRSNTGFMVDNQNAARMYHYQHQKQQMIISDRASTGRHTSASDLDSEEENEEGSYTVYECPGLASAHEMEIKNPLFNDNVTQ